MAEFCLKSGINALMLLNGQYRRNSGGGANLPQSLSSHVDGDEAYSNMMLVLGTFSGGVEFYDVATKEQLGTLKHVGHAHHRQVRLCPTASSPSSASSARRCIGSTRRRSAWRS